MLVKKKNKNILQLCIVKFTMSWLSDAFGKVKNFGRNAVNSISKAGHWVKKNVKSAYNAIKKIPIIGTAVDEALNFNIPFFGGKSVNDIGGFASRGLDIVDKVKDGNIVSAFNDGRQLYRDVKTG